jgi:hypothetical protein
LHPTGSYAKVKSSVQQLDLDRVSIHQQVKDRHHKLTVGQQVLDLNETIGIGIVSEVNNALLGSRYCFALSL